MKIERQLLSLGLGFALGTSLLLSRTLPAGAQNQSDVTGPIITTTTTGPIITTDGTGTNITTNNRNRIAFSNFGIVRAVNTASLTLTAQLNNGSLAVPVSLNRNATAIPPEVQRILLAILRGQSLDNASGSVLVNRFARALSSAPGGPSEQLARNLATSLSGIFAPNNTVNPTRFVAAVKAYNAAIAASSGEFLNNPPPELLATQSVLSTLVNSALAAR